MPSLSNRRIDAWTALAAEPAVRAAERAITSESPTVLAETLAVSTATESRRRLAHVLELKERADREPGSRDEYQRAAEELRAWAAGVYLAALRGPEAPRSIVRHPNPYSEAGISLRRSVPRQPFPR